MELMAAVWLMATLPPESAAEPMWEASKVGLDARCSEDMTRAFLAPVSSCSVTAADLRILARAWTAFPASLPFALTLAPTRQESEYEKEHFCATPRFPRAAWILPPPP